MKRYSYILATLLVGLFVTTSCSNEETPVRETVKPSDNKELVWAYAGMPGSVPMTRLNLKPVTTTTTGNDGTQETLNTLSVTWESTGEGFSVIPSGGGSYAFTQKSIEPDPHKATFSGYMTPVDGADYYAFYPVTTSGNPQNIPLDMTEQDGKLNSDKVYMYDVSTMNNRALNYTFEHLTAVLELTMVFPSVSATAVVQDMGHGGDITPPTSRAIAGKTMTNVTFSAGGLAIKGEANITATVTDPTNPCKDIITSTTQGDINLGSATFTITDNTPLTATVYLHLLPATLTDFNVSSTNLEQC